jgi:tripartite-type tricarboxylate transporter receptor subunit TctC
MRANDALRFLAISLFCTGLTVPSAFAQNVAEFYKGKTITLIIGGSEGGGYDTMARAISRHIGRHIPGNPAIIVRNMPGASGMAATNHLYSAAEKDGTVIGLLQNNNPLAQLFGNKAARFDATKFNWLGTPSIEVAVVVVWHAVPVNSVDDLRTRETTMGASGVQSGQAFVGRLLNATLGTKMRVVPGYKGMGDIFLAMERGEIDGYPGVFYSALAATRPTWLPEKRAKVIVQFGSHSLKELPGVPFATDLTANVEDRLLMEAAAARQALGRPLVMPPGVPADRLVAMRKALVDTFDDPAFLADAKKNRMELTAPQSGHAVQELIVRVSATPAHVVERLQQLSGEAK